MLRLTDARLSAVMTAVMMLVVMIAVLVHGSQGAECVSCISVPSCERS